MAKALHEIRGPRGAALQDGLQSVAGMDSSTPGWSAALIEADGTVTTAIIGVRDAATGSRVDNDTQFATVSTIKVATAMLAGRLALDGRLDLDAGLFDSIGHPEAAGDVAQPTLRQALGNCSGIDNALPANDATLEQAAALAMQVPRLGVPGERFAYSNAAFIAAGYACERAAGMPFADALRELVPAAVDGWLHADTIVELVSAGVATPHDATGSPIDHYLSPGARPTGLGSWATATGLARLGHALANDETLAELLHVEQIQMPDPRVGDAWEHGFAAHLHGEQQLHGWDGVVMGSKAWLRWSRDDRWAVALMANGPAPYDSINRLLEQTDPSLRPPEAMPLDFAAAACAGDYGAMQVELRDGLLWTSGALTGGAWVPLEGNTESGLWMPTPMFGAFPVTFTEVEDGRPTSFYIAPMLFRGD